MLSVARIGALALATTGCFVDEGLPDGSGSTTSPATSSATATSSQTATDPLTTTDPTTATTQVGCGNFGDPCDNGCCGCLTCTFGLCIAAASNCGVCEACQGNGECAVAPNAPCAADDPCPATIWGAEDELCYAYAPVQGRCDADGACVAQPCTDQGEVAVTCADEKCTDPTACTKDMPVESSAGFCVTGGTTEKCGITCDDLIVDSVLTLRECAADGTCAQTDSNNCGNYKCAGPMSCATSCTSDQDCYGSACVDDMCM